MGQYYYGEQMTQPIDRETAIALAKEAGMAGMLTDVVCSLEEIHRLCNLAVAHSRKDAEPVAEVNSAHGDPERFGERRVDVLLSDKAMLKVPYGTKLYPHPPEADKLLQQALEAVLDEHLPGFTEDAPRQHDDVIYDKAIEDAADAIQQLIARTYLENKNA